MRSFVLLFIFSFSLAADTLLAVNASTAAGQDVFSSATFSFYLPEPATATFELDYAGPGCSPFPACNDHQQFSAQLQPPALPSYFIDIGGSGAFIDPAANCDFNVGFNSIVCERLSLPPGNYTLAAVLAAASNGSPELPGTASAKLTLAGDASVVVAPEPASGALYVCLRCLQPDALSASRG